MLEVLTDEGLRARLGLVADATGVPEVGSIADAARACVHNWQSPARSRVTRYLHRQLVAAGFCEEQVRDRVADVIDALIDIGDLIAIRIEGKARLVASRRIFVHTYDTEHVLLGVRESNSSIVSDHRRYVQYQTAIPNMSSVETFSSWLGQADFRQHIARRLGGQADGTVSEFWAILSSSLRHEGSPLDAAHLRAVVAPPGEQNSFFGRHNLPVVSGRWTTAVPDGIWCAVRPGRNPNEWHPIIVIVSGSEVRALDLFDWDEWNWALLARGIANGEPERAVWQNDILAFEYPIPKQMTRALRLLGGPGQRRWTWHLREDAHRLFNEWLRSEV